MPNKLSYWVMLALILFSPVSAIQYDTKQCLLEISTSAIRIYNQDISAQIYNAVSAEVYRDFIIKLTENGSRWTSNGPPIEFSESNNLARTWISRELSELSNKRIEVETIGNHKSIVGILPGWAPYDCPCIMIGGHFDSIPGAPGANDDGTGIATILELARVMANYSWPLDVYFCAWNSEEIGLLGSAEVASSFRKEGLDILVYYNIDMLLVENDRAPIDERVLMVYNSDTRINYHASHLFADITRMMSNNLGLNLIKPEPSLKFPYWAYSDHASFLSEGYRNVLFAFESGSIFDAAYHRPSDAWDNPKYNYTLARETVASIGASIAFIMARAYGQLTHLNYSGTLDSFGSKKYYIAMSTPTNLIVNSHWEGGELKFTLCAPNGSLLESIQKFTTNDAIQSIFNFSIEDYGLYTLILENMNTIRVPYDVEFWYESDVDGNNVSDERQFWFEPEMFNRDLDGDGLVDGHEVLLGTIIWIADTDEDEIPDGWEFNNGLDPLTYDSNLDPDNDELTNLDEYLSQTNPLNNDTDGDLIPDGWEVQNMLDPLVDDATKDPDNDGLSNIEEYQANLDPQVANGFLLSVIISGGISFVAIVVVGFILVRNKVRLQTH